MIFSLPIVTGCRNGRRRIDPTKLGGAQRAAANSLLPPDRRHSNLGGEEAARLLVVRHTVGCVAGSYISAQALVSIIVGSVMFLAFAAIMIAAIVRG